MLQHEQHVFLHNMHRHIEMNTITGTNRTRQIKMIVTFDNNYCGSVNDSIDFKKVGTLLVIIS